MEAPSMATMPIRQFLAYARLAEAIKAHILAEHIEGAGNGYQYQCSVCGDVHDTKEEILLSDHNAGRYVPEDCWVSDIVDLIRRTNE